MPHPVDSLVASLLGLQIKLVHARLRLEAGTDDEALHDLRITLQRLRSLLAPLRRVADLSPLYTAAAAIGTLTAPVRDLEVLAAELESSGHSELAKRRRAPLAEHYAAILDSRELERLQAFLDIWPGELRDAQRAGELRRLDTLIERRLHKQVTRLLEALATPGYDRHRLRLLVKRVRYAGEAYPQLIGLPRRSLRRLKETQSALGDWHDHFQWCLRIEQEADLEPLRKHWQTRRDEALTTAEKQLLRLGGHLRKHTKLVRHSTAL
ncbi:CHAD domain-containing protein [Aquipseudomonas alcaligenes]|uniref:CHAD domain-containing protein n=1 Tax=Aquipseudomonas alcaligenes TaxID=43263 RepID=A0A1N6SLW9_AQUAC|nr:CHAD domain-containing protein [Pseudomonas alcaligenes]SIQ42059.1 CHAD domain-containing protein [Pseudomonas alcaligenes]